METKIEVVTSESEHWYPSKKKNRYYPSVTTILSVYPKGVGFNKYLVAQSSWESSQEILKSAGERGTRVHLGTQALEAGKTLHRDQYSLEEWEMLWGYCGWWRETKPQVVHTEYSLVSEKLKTGGTIDRVAVIDGLLTVLDIKTSSTIHGNYWVQAATYAEMYELKTHDKVEQIAIIRLTDRRKARFEYKTMNREEWKKEFKVFRAIQDVWNHLNPNAGPKILEIPITLQLIETV